VLREGIPRASPIETTMMYLRRKDKPKTMEEALD
jgi:hypothetical protein